jgi:hypothetical protein
MLLLVVVFVLLRVVGFQLIRGLFFRGGWRPEGGPVALIVGARTEEVQKVLMGEAAAREVRACVPRCKTYS